MFFDQQNTGEKDEYQQFLQIAGFLSNLFSDANEPYLHYRVAENLFCKAFNAENLSRSDVSVDAKKGKLGMGLKTFLAGNNNNFQKIAEFNANREKYSQLQPEELARKVSELRNERIEFTKNAHGLDEVIYHCIIRSNGKFKIFEEKMDKINIQSIKGVSKKNNSIRFLDDKHEYSFLISKSTLTKRFITEHAIHEFDVKICDDPILQLRNFINQMNLQSQKTTSKIQQTIYLPLYNIRNNEVPEKSGLNQWNASGRKRNISEVYIPIPSIIHKKFEGFFPSRNYAFNLTLPNGKIMNSKICQDNDKALMSNPNHKLGEWILRDILRLPEGQVVTYSKLQDVGIDSVRIDKISSSEFEINFAKIGSYQEFIDGRLIDHF